jgi:hypothetical protein
MGRIKHVWKKVGLRKTRVRDSEDRTVILLSRGLVTKIDEDDYDRLSQYNWCANKGNKNDTFYAVRGIRRDGKYAHVFMHREIMEASPDIFVDHINHDTLDNRRCNLRLCKQSENLLNKHRSRNGTSKYKGVAFYKKTGKWIVHFRTKHIGYFDSEEDAARAYNVAALKADPAFSLLNSIPDSLAIPLPCE